MSLYVTHFTAAPPGLPSGSALRPVARVFLTQAEATAAGAADGETAWHRSVSDDVRPGWWLVTGAGAGAGNVSAALPAGTLSADADRIAAMRARLHQGWLDRARRDWWPSMRSGANASRPLRALDRWGYHLVAHGDLIASGAWPGTALSLDDRDDRVDHLVARLAAGEIWYNVMVSQEAQSGGGNSALWAAVSVADSAIIYDDSITTAGARRDMDGTFPAMPGATIPAGFNPDTPTLR